MTAGVHLIGGGWSEAAAPQIWGPFLAEAAARTGRDPLVACLVVDEGDGAQQFERFASVLTAVAGCRPTPVLVPIGEVLHLAELGTADALLVCGGLTPAYADVVSPVSAELRNWLADHPYCGFSAGSCIASTSAVVGGWLVDGRPVIPEDAAEDLEEVTVVPGLGLVPFTVDVHAGQWGTLPRLLAAVARSGSPGIAIDENTAVTVVGEVASVVGSGHVHRAVASDNGWSVTRFAAGDIISGTN